MRRARRYRTSEYDGLSSAWRRFAEDAGEPLPDAASIGIAAALGEDVVRFTNSEWVIDVTSLRQDLGVGQLTLLNDFGAMAHAVSVMHPDEFLHVCGPGGALPDDGVTTIMGPGTGLGVAMLLRRDGLCHVIETEGGHTAYAPLDAEEFAIAEQLRERFGRVSIERVASGIGLANLTEAIAALGNRPCDTRDQAALWDNALRGLDMVGAHALDRFVMALGSAAGDIALVQGSNAVVLTGGLVNRMVDRLKGADFVARFCAKGRYQARMQRIPVKIATNVDAGLLGAAVAFQREHLR